MMEKYCPRQKVINTIEVNYLQKPSMSPVRTVKKQLNFSFLTPVPKGGKLKFSSLRKSPLGDLGTN
jgi:hypothetical protein